MSSMDVGAPAHRSGSETRPAAIAHGPGHLVVYGNPAFRSAFAPQLQMYAAVLRNLHGSDLQLRAGLYYPRMSLFDWWEV